MALLYAARNRIHTLGFDTLYLPFYLEQIDHPAVDHGLAFDHLVSKALKFSLISTVFFTA